MARNRRNSSGYSYKSAIGIGCIKLFLTVAAVITCASKVIIGGEFISACPVEPLLPVYVVLSGCFPVFLGPLRDSDQSGDNRNNNRICRMSGYAKAVLTFGVVSNIVWLILGTVLVERVASLGNANETKCNRNGLTNQTRTNLTVGLTETGPPISTQLVAPLNGMSEELEEANEAPGRKSRDHSQPIMDSPPSDLKSRGLQDSLHDDFVTPAGSLIKHGNKTMVDSSKDTTRMITTMPHEHVRNMTGSKHELTSSRMNVTNCVQCHSVLVKFAIAIVIIDWMCVAFGLVLVFGTVLALVRATKSLPCIT